METEQGLVLADGAMGPLPSSYPPLWSPHHPHSLPPP